jgi:hypothetical protein
MDNSSYLSYYSKETQNPQAYEELSNKITNWCSKLYQDGQYSYKQYQNCLDQLDSGSIEFNKDNEENVDENKDLERIYGYYKKDKEKINIDTSNPAKPIVKDDFQKMTLYHSKISKYLISEEDGILSLGDLLEDVEQKEWQLLSLGKKDDENIFAIMSKYGKFIIGNEDGSVMANTTILSTWCQWKMIKYNNNFAFKSVIHKKYLAPVGQELLLVDGWSDNNLWVLQNKELPTGKNAIKFDNTELMTKKEELLNRYYTAYRNYLDYKYQSQYYYQKMDQLSTIRNNQSDYLLNIADENKKILMGQNPSNKPGTTPTPFQSTLQTESSNLDDKCKLEKLCLDTALEYSKQPNVPLSDKDEEDRINKIYDSKMYCDWSETEIEDISKYKYVEQPLVSCNTKETPLDENDYQKRLNEIALFKNDVGVAFSELKETEYQKLYQLISDSDATMNENYDTYKQAESELDAFITNLSDEIKTSETKIYNLTDSLDIKLDKQQQLILKNAMNEPPRTYEELSNIINSNFNIAKDNLKTQKNQLYYLFAQFIITLIIIFYISFKSLKKYRLL